MQRVETRALGRTGVQVSPLCLGAMMFGGWGNPDHDESIRIIHRALDAGINFIDTADVYSAGESEEIVGKALAGGSATRSCSRPSSTARWATIRTSGQLAPLDHPGGRQQPAPPRHRLDRPLPGAPPRPLASTSTRRSARSPTSCSAGKVRYIGSSTFPAHEIVEAQWVAERRGRERFVCEQPPYSMLVRGDRDRRAAGLRAVRHGRDPVEPARGRLAVRAATARARTCRRARRAERHPAALRPVDLPRTSASSRPPTRSGALADEAGLTPDRAGAGVRDPAPRGHVGDHRPAHDGAAREPARRGGRRR